MDLLNKKLKKQYKILTIFSAIYIILYFFLHNNLFSTFPFFISILLLAYVGIEFNYYLKYKSSEDFYKLINTKEEIAKNIYLKRLKRLSILTIFLLVIELISSVSFISFIMILMLYYVLINIIHLKKESFTKNEFKIFIKEIVLAIVVLILMLLALNTGESTIIQTLNNIISLIYIFIILYISSIINILPNIEEIKNKESYKKIIYLLLSFFITFILVESISASMYITKYNLIESFFTSTISTILLYSYLNLIIISIIKYLKLRRLKCITISVILFEYIMIFAHIMSEFLQIKGDVILINIFISGIIIIYFLALNIMTLLIIYIVIYENKNYINFLATIYKKFIS